MRKYHCSRSRLWHAGVPAPADAAAVHLLVGQHGLAAGAAPLPALGAVGQPAPIQQQEEPLRPAIEFRRAGVDLPFPVVGAAQQRHLTAVGGGVAGSGLPGRHAPLDRLVLRGQAERIPAHRMQHVVPAHPIEAGEHVGWHVVSAVPHAQAVARGIGEEVQDVELGPDDAGLAVGRAVQAPSRPSVVATSSSTACGM